MGKYYNGVNRRNWSAISVNKIFVYGTLKSGFSNHLEMLSGQNCLGSFLTIEKYPLVITGPWYSPVMFPEPGVGHYIQGEVYEVNDKKLAELDEFEYVHLSKGFRRLDLTVISNQNEKFSVQAYMRARKHVKQIWSDYIDNYQDHRYIHASRR